MLPELIFPNKITRRNKRLDKRVFSIKACVPVCFPDQTPHLTWNRLSDPISNNQSSKLIFLVKGSLSKPVIKKNF